jgi:acetolactate synthase-1/2/3 large subunit
LGPKFLTQLTRKGNIPVTTTLQGLGVFNETDPKSLHMIGMHGSTYANIAMQQVDVVIALGAHFDDHVTGKISQFAPATRAVAAQGRGGFIHFKILPKNIACHLGGSSGAAALSRVESSQGVCSTLLFQVPYKAKYR